MSCDHEDCECRDNRPKHWTDAVKHVAEAIVLIALFYFVWKCHG